MVSRWEEVQRRMSSDMIEQQRVISWRVRDGVLLSLSLFVYFVDQSGNVEAGAGPSNETRSRWQAISYQR